MERADWWGQHQYEECRRRERNMQIVFMCVKRAEAERDTVSCEETERKWQTWLEERSDETPEGQRGEPAAPSQHCSSLPPCVLCHGYQTRLPMQPVNVFFSGWSEQGTNVSVCLLQNQCQLSWDAQMQRGLRAGNSVTAWKRSSNNTDLKTVLWFCVVGKLRAKKFGVITMTLHCVALCSVLNEEALILCHICTK